MKKVHRPAGDLDVHVKGKNIAITPALHDQVVSKMGRLDRYLDRLQKIEVELSTERTREAAQHNHVEVITYVAGRSIRVTSSHQDMYAAIDETVDKLYRRLNRQKERIKSHHATRFVDPSADVLEPAGPVDEDTASGDVPITIEYLDVKPQFEDEAVETLIAEGRQFYVFLNARTEKVNVLYCHPEGGYGLIEPVIR
jgi:putative sigma-54 modulation protein